MPLPRLNDTRPSHHVKSARPTWEGEQVIGEDGQAGRGKSVPESILQLSSTEVIFQKPVLQSDEEGVTLTNFFHD
jgi:hypothetical protein